ncbi:MAG TPA: hypothetical protein VHY30_10390 [Verrucomicrobiae bacterium]|jgi:hypothetical protein|nr:hypothetical protein [Verrucomicrobiae bacterium]
MIESQIIFSAAQIAAALGIKPQSVRGQLRDVQPAGVQIVAGNEAVAFSIDQLPVQLRERLAAKAVQQRCRTVEAVLAMPRKQWQPAIPRNKVSDADIQIATKRRDALKPWLIQQHDPRLSAAEMERRAVEDYRHIFGNRISTRYWRELFMRTLRRDNGAEEWNRLEIYLPDRLKLKDAPTADVSKALAEDFAELESFIAGCTDPHAPNKTECAAVWTLTLEKFKSLVNAGEPEKSAARRVRQFLFARASFLAVSRDALWVAFKRKLKALKNFQGDAKAFRDGREENGANFELPENDRDTLIHRAVFYYRGDIAPAWRDLLRKGFSQEVVERYAGRAQRKSHVPASVMDSIRSEVEILTIKHRGPRAFDAIKGHVTRSYDGISSLQCISGDDFTLNTYFYVPDGNGWFNLTRGQVILFIDFRSSRILGCALEPRKSYSSLTIRSLCTHVFGEFGVPEILYFERGLWKSASLLKGKTDPFDFTQISQGLREFGIVFKHAIRPRTKTVERIGGLFQDIAEAEPGYCGRMEMKDAPESLRKQMAEVETRKTHPSKYFYSLEQWNDRIRELVNQYNGESQQGIICAGMSPEQAFEAHMNKTNPPMQFTAGLRYLLANDKRLARVTLNGITIQIGKQKFNYRGQEIAHLVGCEVLAWFDPENPEIITVTNPDRTNPICVSRSENPNALESLIAPDAGTLGRELARIEGQASHMKTRFNVIKAKFPLPQRQLLAAAQVVELGEEIAAQKNEITEVATRRQRQRGRANKFAQRTGITVPDRAQDHFNPDDAKFLSEFLDGEKT